jgi:hypothetical protein
MQTLSSAESKLQIITGGGFYACYVAGCFFRKEQIAEIVNHEANVIHLCFANLICENDNIYDENAVRVEIEDKKVGFLPRTINAAYRKALKNSNTIIQCPAMIYGEKDVNYGIKLDLPYKYISLQSSLFNT